MRAGEGWLPEHPRTTRTSRTV
ncbi:MULTISPECIES: hypothetical protein [unclassified Streptomyces]